MGNPLEKLAARRASKICVRRRSSTAEFLGIFKESNVAISLRDCLAKNFKELMKGIVEKRCHDPSTPRKSGRKKTRRTNGWNPRIGGLVDVSPFSF